MGTCYSKKKKKSTLFIDDDLPFPQQHSMSGQAREFLDRQDVAPDVLDDGNSPGTDTEDSIYEDIDHQLQPVKPIFMKQAHKKRLVKQISNMYKSYKVMTSSVEAEGMSAQGVTVTNNDRLFEEHMQYMVYSEMIQIFKPMIVNNILIHDILQYLSFLEDHADLYDVMKNRSQKNAVVRLLDEIDKSEEPGKWKIFMDALSKSGYTYIVDTIRGYIFINRRYQVEYVKRHTPEIGRMISPPALIPYLIANELITDTDRDNILCECNNRGDYAGAVLLLDRITRKHGNWYMLFIKALEDASCYEVAAKLRVTELMEHGRFKDKDVNDWYAEVEPFRESQNVVVPSMGYKRAASLQHVSNLSDNGGHDLIEDPCGCEYTYVNQDIEIHHNVFGSPPVPPRPKQKKAPVPTPRKRFMYYLTPIFVDDICNAEEESPTETNDVEMMFSDIKKEVHKLEQEKQKRKFENYLLEKKLELNDEVIDILKKRRELLGSLSEKEEERKELHTVDIETQGIRDNQITDGKTEQQLNDVISLDAIHNKETTDDNTSLMLENLDQLTLTNTMDNPLNIPRPHTSLVRSRGNIMLPIYTLNNNKNDFLRLPQDSGFGTVDYGSDIKLD